MKRNYESRFYANLLVFKVELSIQAVGALGELSDKSDFSLLAWDSFSQEIRNLLLFYCQKSLNLLQMQ